MLNDHFGKQALHMLENRLNLDFDSSNVSQAQRIERYNIQAQRKREDKELEVSDTEGGLAWTGAVGDGKVVPSKSAVESSPRCVIEPSDPKQLMCGLLCSKSSRRVSTSTGS